MSPERNAVIKMILAVDKNNSIGWSDGRLPWKIPYDMKRFRELTTRNTVVMGFKTFQSLNLLNGLPNRKNIVLTNKSIHNVLDQIGPNIEIINSLEAIKELQTCSQDIYIIGGASVYAQALEAQIVDELHVTLVHDNSGADVTLPFELYNIETFISEQQEMNVQWQAIKHLRPTVQKPSPGIDIIVFRKVQ
jgi:dihydrofolate reductase